MNSSGLTVAEAAATLRSHGYSVREASGDEVSLPRLSIRVLGHEEWERHTWYTILCELFGASGGCWPQRWRLGELRKGLHDRIKRDLGEAYKVHFRGQHFPCRGGLPGTTAQLQGWFGALSAGINARALPASSAASSLEYLGNVGATPALGLSLGPLSDTSSRRREKVVFVGDIAGKTSLISRLVFDTYEECTQATIGIDFLTKTVADGPSKVRLQLWDTSGPERFRPLLPTLLHEAKCVVLVYDITNRQSFLYATRTLLADARESCEHDTPILLVGTKADLEDRRAVSTEEGRDLAQDVGAACFAEVSAKTGHGTANLLQDVVRALSHTTLAVTLRASHLEPRGLQIACTSLAGNELLALRLGSLRARDRAEETLRLLVQLLASQMQVSERAVKLVLPCGALVPSLGSHLLFSDILGNCLGPSPSSHLREG